MVVLRRSRHELINEENEMKNAENKICRKVAEIYTRRVWHGLSEKEKVLVGMLEDSGYLEINIPPNGIVGNAPTPPQPQYSPEQAKRGIKNLVEAVNEMTGVLHVFRKKGSKQLRVVKKDGGSQSRVIKK